MKKYFLSLLLILSLTVFGQHQTDNWYFGWNAGIDFSSGIPLAVTGGALVTTEGCSSISDNAGNLLFYTEGVSVWNRNHQVMPNGTGLLGNVSSTQSALVVPKPGSTTEYYIFTVDEIGGPNGFRYSIVDMTLDGGLGDVTVKNILILNNVTEKLTAVQQTSSGNYWIAVHEWGTDAFYVYLLTSSGLSAPVVSNTGIVHSNLNIQNTFGQMKFNPCGNMIAAAMAYLDTVEVFYFDNLTGQVYNPFTLPMGAHVYGLEFSDNGSKLYVTTYDATLGTLVQFDLTVMQIDSILASKTGLTLQEDLYGMQLGIDGRIYVVHSWSTFLGVINLPNQDGFNCNWDLFGFNLDPNSTGIMSSLGLPGFVQSYLKKEFSCALTSINAEVKNSEDITIYPNPFHNSATISFSNSLSAKNLRLRVFDSMNRLVREEKIHTQNEYAFYSNGLSNGIYSVQIMNDEGFLANRRLVIN
jgi:hypothetical protein